MMPPQSVPNTVLNVDSHTGSVCLSESRMNTSAYRNSFHAVMNANTDVATRPGPSSGSTTRRKAPNRPQPSTIAASSSSNGMPATNPRSVHTVNGSVIAKYTSTSDGSWLSSP